MNLYSIDFTHYSQKDNASGFLGYVLANNAEQVYEFLKTSPELNGEYVSVSWEYYENDGRVHKLYNNYDEPYAEIPYKDYLISIGGEINDEYANLDDLYYGKTLYGWTLVKENIQKEQSNALMETIGLIVLGEEDN